MLQCRLVVQVARIKVRQSEIPAALVRRVNVEARNELSEGESVGEWRVSDQCPSVLSLGGE